MIDTNYNEMKKKFIDVKSPQKGNVNELTAEEHPPNMFIGNRGLYS